MLEQIKFCLNKEELFEQRKICSNKERIAKTRKEKEKRRKMYKTKLKQVLRNVAFLLAATMAFTACGGSSNDPTPDPEPTPTPTPTPVPRVFTVTPKSNPYQNRYIKTAAFTEKTRSHYVLLSYMEYFSTIGGGELHLKKGVYNLAYNLYVPSNVTLVFEDGVIIKSLKNANTSRKNNSAPINMLQIFNTHSNSHSNTFTVGSAQCHVLLLPRIRKLLFEFDMIHLFVSCECILLYMYVCVCV